MGSIISTERGGGGGGGRGRDNRSGALESNAGKKRTPISYDLM
jgi:hypothetical protein